MLHCEPAGGRADRNALKAEFTLQAPAAPFDSAVSARSAVFDGSNSGAVEKRVKQQQKKVRLKGEALGDCCRSKRDLNVLAYKWYCCSPLKIQVLLVFQYLFLYWKSPAFFPANLSLASLILLNLT